MIKLCIDARMAFFSGIGTFIREIVPKINTPPFYITLLVNLKNQKWCEGIDQIEFKAPIYSIKEQLQFPFIVPSCDLFWSPHYNVPLFPIKACKRVVTIHDACHLAMNSFSALQKGYAKVVMRSALHRSNAVITDSFFSKSELISYLKEPKQGIQVTHIGGGRDFFCRVLDQERLAQVRMKYRLPDRFILFVGNHKPNKNLMGLLDAFSRMDILDLGLVIVGKGEKIKCRKMVFQIGEVLDEELPVLYSLASVFVFPSFYEGFGLPPLEAMSCGCPVVVSDRASLPEVCGNASLYVDPDKPDEIADAVSKIINSEELKKDLRVRGYEQVKKFNWNNAASSYRNILESVYRSL